MNPRNFYSSNSLRYSSNLWKLITHDAGIDYDEWPRDNMTKIISLRKLAYKQGYVDHGGYKLTTLGEAFVQMLD